MSHAMVKIGQTRLGLVTSRKQRVRKEKTSGNSEIFESNLWLITTLVSYVHSSHVIQKHESPQPRNHPGHDSRETIVATWYVSSSFETNKRLRRTAHNSPSGSSNFHYLASTSTPPERRQSPVGTARASRPAFLRKQKHLRHTETYSMLQQTDANISRPAERENRTRTMKKKKMDRWEDGRGEAS